MLSLAKNIDRLDDEVKGYYAGGRSDAVSSLIGDIREALKALSWQKYCEEKGLEQ